MKQFELFGKETLLDIHIPIEDVFEAYYDCRKCKRRTVNAIVFEMDFEKELISLWKEINSGTYRIGRSIAFIVQKPVQREIFAADFRDRVVHHLIISKINHLFEDEFVENSFSCRTGKGTLFGVQSLKKQIQECSEKYTQDCYILKLDIQSFFMSINKDILYNMLYLFLQEKYQAPDKKIILRLIKQIIYNNPENNCVIKGKLADWNGLPCKKSLFWSPKNKGLAIGNLTSQIFANFYLNRMDKYITQELGFEYYGRYVDDFFLIHRDKNRLIEARKQIEIFLKEKLDLTLHPNKVYLQHYSRGVKFIGAFVKPHRIYVGKRTKHNLYQKIYSHLPKLGNSVESVLSGIEKFCSSINSYLGFMRYYNTYNLRQKVLSILDQSFLGEISELVPDATKLSINKLFRSREQKKAVLRRQRQHRHRKYKKIKKEEKDGTI